MVKPKKIGILGGGQLGRMLSLAASNYGASLYFLDKSKAFPAGQVATHFTEGSFNSFDDVLNFGRQMDVLSIEIENVNIDALSILEKEGVHIFPQPRVISTIKDKGIQKQFYLENNIPTSRFSLAANKQEIVDGIQDGSITLPFVQKARTGGYDGKGVQLIRTENDIEFLMDTPSVIEDLVNIDKELSVIVCRDQNGNTMCFDVVEMVFDPEINLVDYLFSPAAISKELSKTCIELASSIAEKLNIIGILAVEMFLSKDGEILINEMAPRTHNSGHHTMNSCNYSQFDQHFRILAGFDVKESKQHHFSAMVNIIGAPEYTGSPIYDGLSTITSEVGIYPHIYGKTLTKPGRKMGHVNITGEDLKDVEEKIRFIKSNLKVISNG